MHLQRLPPEEPAARRFAEDLWLPYQRDLAAAVDRHALADDLDLADEVEFRLDALAGDAYRGWVAVDHPEGPASGAVDLAETDAPLAGFVLTDVDECPGPFERPDRLVVCDLYVEASHRGTGLAATLMDRARERAREADCGELSLEVGADNERALAFYEKCGFEVGRHELFAPVED